MINIGKTFVVFLIIQLFLLVGLKGKSIFAESLNKKKQSPVLKNKTEKKQLESRIDFGNAYIMGQTIKSGAVYLLQRKPSEIKSMLKYRENYREEILKDFYIQDKNTK